MLSRLGKVLLVVSPLLAAGCGFQPLHNAATQAGGPAGFLSETVVEEQDTRIGQLVRNEILSGYAPSQVGITENYLLVLRPRGRQRVNVRVRSTEATRYRYQLNVDFELIDNATGKKVYAGSTFSDVSYDSIEPPVANVQAEINAHERAAREVGNDIRTRLAVYFANRGT